MIVKCANAYYFRVLNSIGGIESHLYYIARKYGSKDIVVFYKTADAKQLARLKRYVRCVGVTHDLIIECDKLFCCFNREILDQVRAKEKCLVLHGDYLAMVEKGQLIQSNLPIDERIDKYYGVSQVVCDNWTKLTGIPCENLFQPVVLDTIKKPLLLLSATRLSSEKGFNRMCQLAKALDESKISYQWHIYTNDTRKVIDSENVQFLKPTLDIANIMPLYDGFVQLSDNEGFCLSVVEAWLRGLPCIITPLPVLLNDLGADETNSIVCDFDMRNIPIGKIENIKKMKFKYVPPKDRWEDALVDTPTNYNPKIKKIYKCVTTDAYLRLHVKDTCLNRIPSVNETIMLDESRYYLLTNNIYNEQFVKLIEIIEDEVYD